MFLLDLFRSIQSNNGSIFCWKPPSIQPPSWNRLSANRHKRKWKGYGRGDRAINQSLCLCVKTSLCTKQVKAFKWLFVLPEGTVFFYANQTQLSHFRMNETFVRGLVLKKRQTGNGLGWEDGGRGSLVEGLVSWCIQKYIYLYSNKESI